MEKRYSLILILILVLSLSVIALGYKSIEYKKEADEGYYLGYAKFLDAKGLSGYPGLFKEYIHSREMWIFPNPLRAGFYILSTVWLNFMGFTFFSLSLLSTLFFLLFLLISFYFCRRYFGDNLAVFYILLLAFSPLNTAMAGRALTESTLLFFQAASIWLFWDYLQSQKKMSLFLLSFSLIAGILIKELSVIFPLIFGIILSFKRFYNKRKFSVLEFILICVLPPLVFAWVIAALGGAPYLLRTARIILISPRINSYAILYGKGPWYRYLIDYLALSPWIFILSCGFILQYLVSKKRDGLITYLLLVSVAVFCILNLFTKNIRYVLILDISVRLFALLMLKSLCDRYFPRAALPALFVSVLILGAADYLSFYNYFIQGRIYDPSSAALFKANLMVPQEYFYAVK
jgi:4-amino-4-deoxy-L-arabinose transferase-like glycosyltransferase